jgi:hypothetical protein
LSQPGAKEGNWATLIQSCCGFSSDGTRPSASHSLLCIMSAPQIREIEAQVGRLVSSAHEPPDITIVVDDARLPAHSFILRLHSSCARGMPPSSDEWDVSNLRIGDKGDPPSKLIVLTWLEWLYCPCGTKAYTPADIVEALPLLQFADAVGTRADVLGAMAKSCKWAVTVAAAPGAHPSVELTIDRGAYIVTSRDSSSHIVLLHEDPVGSTTMQILVDQPFAHFSEQEIQECAGEDAAVQVEEVLYVALAANLTELADETRVRILASPLDNISM